MCAPLQNSAIDGTLGKCCAQCCKPHRKKPLWLLLPDAERFEPGNDVPAAGSEARLAQVVTFLAAKASITLLRAETDAAALSGRDANLALGTARAKRLAAWFSDHGAELQGERPLANRNCGKLGRKPDAVHDCSLRLP
jgi:hypothetical protein